MTLKKQKLVCEYCGSDDIVADAYAVWNLDKGAYELSATFDAKFCQNETCVAQINGYDQKGEWVDVPEETKLCSVCSEPQFDSPGGITCSNGHGGADPK
jgi:hypothetical protein